jgi:hypothetical protein
MAILLVVVAGRAKRGMPSVGREAFYSRVEGATV